MEEKIDFVVTWVDGSDKKWQEDRNYYSLRNCGDSRIKRYRDWDLLKYWFRGVENFAPWVNKIHFVTYGHLPNWLNTKHPQLNIVRHKDFIPQEFLPTFNSNAIELNIHRIQGLAEQFVYFNDDVFLINNVKQEDFFHKGIPCDAAVLGCVLALEDDIYNIIFNNVKIINRYFNKRKWLKENLGEIFNPKYGKYLLRTFLLLPFSKHTGFYDFHLSMTFRKQTFLDVWGKEPETLYKTCCNKFRTADDVNIWLMRYWQLAGGQYKAYRILGQYFEIGDTRINSFIAQGKNKIICCNDVRENIDFQSSKENLRKAFETRLSKKSQFEL